MSDQFFRRASDDFYNRVDAALKAMGQPFLRSSEECRIVDEFSGHDFGPEPCAQHIAKQRADKTSS